MRASGTLMPIFSLPSPYGIGTFGAEAYRFVDFLEEAGQQYWQILPLTPTHYGDSPYQSFSADAGNPYFIDLDRLAADGLLTAEDYIHEDFGSDASAVDYGKLYEHRLPVLRRAFARFTATAAFAKFCDAERDWLEDYALFMALKDAHGGDSWRRWEKPLRRREPEALAAARARYADELEFYRFLQFEFYTQWNALKEYAHAHGVRIIGDMPIYVADDSADVWAHTALFDLDEDLLPRVVAGCPPDAFSEEGQLWGMPVYNWDVLAADTPPYGWWVRRVRHALAVYDVVRIDHFRGFEAFYCIPYGSENAKHGVWRKGPGMAFFRALEQSLGAHLPIIAEDLGTLTQGVYDLLDATGFAGMNVLQFAFDPTGESLYLPHHHTQHSVVYVGTHDNDTAAGWVRSAAPEEVAYARRYLHVDDREGFPWAMIRAALASVADTAILTMQDYMGLSSEARINTPSTLGGNWQWRIDGGCINDWLAHIIRENVALYGRLPVPHDERKTNTQK